MLEKTTILNLPEEEFLYPGNRACSGCGLGIAYRIGLKALGRDTMLVVPPSCLTVLQGLYPIAATKMPCINVTFASTAAAASGVTAALRALGRDNITIVAWAGDGGTSDIGLQALSGAIERMEDFIYICYDNEGYMNTGVQRSGTTPRGAVTTNTPLRGKMQPKKDLPAIMAAHKLPYVATCSVSYPLDLYDKIRKARTLPGTKYLHILTPCPPGWGFNTKDTVRIGRLAVETGLFDLFEIEQGKFKLTGASNNMLTTKKMLPVTDYFKVQSRFRQISGDIVTQIQKDINARWHKYSTGF